MGPGVKENKTLTKQGSKCFKLSTIFLLLNIGNFVAPVTGFALRNCRISDKNAICTKSSPKLKAVPQDIPPTVTGFDLSDNSISKIHVSDFKNLPVLTTLSLQANRILQIDSGAFANLISLRRLNLNGNNLQELTADLFYGLRNLTELRISHNHIKVVASTSFKSLTSLTFLDISYNNLKDLTKVHSILLHLPNLQTLLLKSNNLVSFQSWELTNSSLKLTSLDLSQNPLQVFRITSDVFPKLTWFSIGGTPKKQQTTWDVRNKTFISRVSTLDISGLRMARDDMKTLLESVNSSLTSLRMDAMTYLPPLISISCTVPTMSSLKLRKNELRFIRPDLFKLCINIIEIDLSDNKIKNISDSAFRSIPGLRILSLSRNKLSSVPVATRNLPSLAELDLSTNNISTLGCDDFANLTKLRQLNLYQNSISFLKGCVFKDLGQLQVLKLQNNSISKLGNVFTTKHLSNLRQLHLNQNKLQAITIGTFEGLQSLQNLSLHDNQIQELQKGCFRGLTNLTTILLQTNKLNEDKINTGALNDLINLQRLDMRNNQIKYKNCSQLRSPPFSNLSRLEILAMPAQRRRGKAYLPSNILQGLTNLKVFNTRNIQLLSMPKDMFKYTPKLSTLDISSNNIVDLSPDLFSPIQNLTSLYISRTSLRSLDFLINANLTELEHMQARWNGFSVMNKEVIKALPALIYVDLQGNSFTCDCDNAWFLQWITNDNQTQVFDAYNFECNYPPDLNGRKLLKLDVQSCSVYDFICFVSTTCMILLVMVVSFTYHFLRGQLAYAYYLFLAWLFDSRQRNKQTHNQYDAFISYNTHDEPWVIGQLLPKLEGEQGWRLCLHHRDFEPGKPIIDNITDAIYGSRKTICVITRRYLESEWCSKEIQVASFRLFDEQKDVLILLLLEDIPTSQLSPYYRMRKLLKRQTYLSWPQAGEHTELFWEKLRQALKTREDLSEDRLHLNIMG